LGGGTSGSRSTLRKFTSVLEGGRGGEIEAVAAASAVGEAA
jgi:hypothetical protein